jgi:hypothetical protein
MAVPAPDVSIDLGSHIKFSKMNARGRVPKIRKPHASITRRTIGISKYPLSLHLHA